VATAWATTAANKYWVCNNLLNCGGCGECDWCDEVGFEGFDDSDDDDGDYVRGRREGGVGDWVERGDDDGFDCLLLDAAGSSSNADALEARRNQHRC
jgi:hypothetical protein